MTKKDKILTMFNNLDWISNPSGMRIKVITTVDIEKIDLSPSWEYGEQYNDVIYIKRVLQKLGYTVLVGNVIWVREKIKK